MSLLHPWWFYGSFSDQTREGLVLQVQELPSICRSSATMPAEMARLRGSSEVRSPLRGTPPTMRIIHHRMHVSCSWCARRDLRRTGS